MKKHLAFKISLFSALALVALFLFASCSSKPQAIEPKIEAEKTEVTPVETAAVTQNTPAPTETPIPEPEPITAPDEITKVELTAAEKAELESKALEAIEAVKGAEFVSDDDNRMKMVISGIEKSNEDYIIRWDFASDIMRANPGNSTFAFSKIHYLDALDFSSNYVPFTLEDGSINVDFEDGDEISYTQARVKFEPESKILFMFFEGATKEDNAPEEIITKPLFFTFILGDSPYLLEEQPRYASKDFFNAIK